jgi:hypothetical protein
MEKGALYEIERKSPRQTGHGRGLVRETRTRYGLRKSKKKKKRKGEMRVSDGTTGLREEFKNFGSDYL